MTNSWSKRPYKSPHNDGKTLEESGKEHWALTDQQKTFLKEDHVRHVLAMKLENVEVAAKWNNELQAFTEKMPHGIPVNISSDPRHGASKSGAEYRAADHLRPFVEGAFALDGPTGSAASVMPYYSISWGLDVKGGKNVGNSYSTYLIKDLLREKYGFDGVVCTDWGITGDPNPNLNAFGSRCYGVEALTEAQRHLLALENGVDQFGGNSDIVPILEAYRLGCETYGEAAMRSRFERSAVPYRGPDEFHALSGSGLR